MIRNKKMEKLGAAGGILFVLMQMAGQGFIQIGGSEPAFNAPVSEIVTFFMNRNRRLFEIGGYLSSLSIIPFLWFLGVLWARLRQHKGEPGWLSMTAFGSGLAAVAVTLSGGGWGLAMFRIDEGMDPGIIQMLFDQGNFGFATFWVALAGMLLATAAVTFQNGALPRWNGWLGMVVAVALLIARLFWAVPTFLLFMPYTLFWLWLTLTSVILYRHAGASIPVQPAPAKG